MVHAQGDYPANMRTILGRQLPQFTQSQKSDLATSMDFFALNYYTSHYVKGNGPNHVSSAVEAAASVLTVHLRQVLGGGVCALPAVLLAALC